MSMPGDRRPDKFRHGEGIKSNSQARARRFVHLAENHPDFRFRQIFLVDHACFTHFLVKVVTFTRALAYTRKHRDATVTFSDVVDELHDDNGFANTGAAKRADLASFRERTNQVNHLDSRFKDLHSCVLLGEMRGLAMDRITLFEFYGTAVINRIARHIKKATEYTLTHRHCDRSASIGHAHPTLEAVRRRHGDGTHPVFTQMLLDLEDKFRRVAVDLVLDFERVINFW